MLYCFFISFFALCSLSRVVTAVDVPLLTKQSSSRVDVETNAEVTFVLYFAPVNSNVSQYNAEISYKSHNIMTLEMKLILK